MSQYASWPVRAAGIFTGTFSGDVTGGQGSTVVQTVGGASASSIAAAVAGIAFTPSFTRYVSKNGNDSTGDGSYSKPFLTIQAAEAAITTATTANPFVIIIFPGFYTPAAGFLKKPNIFWVGTNRKATLIGTGQISSTGIKITADATGGRIGFLHLTFQGPKGINLIQTPASGPLSMWLEDVRLGFSPSITATGIGGGSLYIEIHHSDILGAVNLHSSYMYSTGTYYGGAITADGQGALFPQTPVIVNGDTVQGSQTVTFVSTAGINQGDIISGAGIPPGTQVGNVDATTIDISSPATATATNVPFSFTANISSTVEVFHGSINGITFTDQSGGTLGAFNRDTTVIDSAGSSVLAIPDAIGSRSRLTIDPDATLTMNDDVSVIDYTPTTPGNWIAQPTNGLEALDNLAAQAVSALASVGSSPAAEGASLFDRVLTLQPADASNPGVVSIGDQNLGSGIKTIQDGAIIGGGTGAAVPGLKVKAIQYSSEDILQLYNSDDGLVYKVNSYGTVYQTSVNGSNPGAAFSIATNSLDQNGVHIGYEGMVDFQATADSLSLILSSIYGGLWLKSNGVLYAGGNPDDVTRRHVESEPGLVVLGSYLNQTGNSFEVRGYIGATQDKLLLSVDVNGNTDLNSNKIINVADPSSAQDAATKAYVDGKILVFTSSAGSGGAATEVMTVTGILATDTILSVSQSVPGASSLPLIGFNTLANNAITGVWSADPSAGAILVVAVKR